MLLRRSLLEGILSRTLPLYSGHSYAEEVQAIKEREKIGGDASAISSVASAQKYRVRQ